MNDVLNFQRSEPPAYEPPKSKFGHDETYLKWCAEWRAARAQQQKNWAEHEAAIMWGTLPDKDIELDMEPLSRMHELEYILAMTKPRTMLLALELLRICITILAHEDQDATLAEDCVYRKPKPGHSGDEARQGLGAI